MITINTAVRTAPPVLAHDPVNDAGLSELIAQEQFSKELKSKRLSDSALMDRITGNQILQSDESRVPDAKELAEELAKAIDRHESTESDWQDFVVAMSLVNDEVRNDLLFDPGAWEKHANVLVAAIIALSISRVANAHLRGHFSVMAADAAKAQGTAIVESGKAALNAAITNAVVSGVIAGFAMINTLHGQAFKHADINLNKRDSLDASNIKRDLQRDRNRDDWDPQTTYKIKTFDDLGRMTSFNLKPKGSALTPQEHALFDKGILNAQKVSKTSDWQSEMGAKSIERKLEIGRFLNAMAMSMSQMISSAVRMTEHAAREQEVLQQSAQNTHKSLSDEVAQKDAAEEKLRQQLVEMMAQISQSKIGVIGTVAKA